MADDVAEVSTTKLMMPAAAGNPPSRNNSTNGLRLAGTLAQEMTLMMHTSEQM
ncbi:hypothetical protein D3C71_2240200 [compost metagenome]